MPSNGRRSTLLWDDVPPEQRTDHIPALLTGEILSVSQSNNRLTDNERLNILIGDLLRPWLRGKLKRITDREVGRPACPMATQQTYDKQRRLWLYAPCANPPRTGERFCWRHLSSEHHAAR